MSWLFSQALVEAFSAATCSDGAPSAPSNTTPTPQAYLSPDRMKAFSRLSQFGMTFAPLTDIPGVVEWTLSRADSLAPTSARPAGALASTARPAASGPRWRELSVRYDLATSSWKTHRCLFPVDLPESSVTLPKWGMMRGGLLWERMTSARPIGAKGFGSLLATPTAKANQLCPSMMKNPGCANLWPTPRASEGAKQPNDANRDSPCLSWVVKNPQMWPTPKASAAGPDFAKMDRSATGISLQTAVRQWPTPQAHDAAKGDARRVGRFGTKHGGRNLNDEVAMFPTPTVACATGGQTSRGGDRKNELLLTGFVKQFPTPKSRDGKGQSQRGIHAQGDALPNMDRGDGAVIGGSLNPTWVEWLMGWPLGWTDCAASGMDKYRSWLRSHGRF